MRRIFEACVLCVVLLGVAAHAVAAPAYVSSGTGSNFVGSTTSTPATAAFDTSGSNFMVVAIRWNRDASEDISSITDTAGNTYQVATGAVDTYSARLEIWYAMNTSTHASNVVTVTMSAAVDYWSVNAAAYSGMATSSALDAVPTPGQDGIGNNSVTTGTFTTNQADELIVGASDTTATGGTWSVGTGLTTVRVQDASTVVALADKIVSSIQTNVTATMTSTLTNSKHIVAATFKAAGGGGGAVASSGLLIGVGR